MQGNRQNGQRRRGWGTVQSITTTKGQSEIIMVLNQLAVKLEPFAKHLFFLYLKKGDIERTKRCCSYKAEERLLLVNITGSSRSFLLL